MTTRLMLLILLAAAPLAAQTPDCAAGETRGDAIRCYQAEMKKADGDMQAALDHLLANFAPSEENLKGLKAETREKQRRWYASMQKQLQASQAAFLAYRDQTCSIFDVEYAEGTMRPVAVMDCRLKLTKARAQWLRDNFQDEGD
jgi:uncharacterized protein YecT (DUF1311 family)